MILLYLQWFAIALIGWTLQTTLKIKSIKVKSKAANVDFKIISYFKEDYLSILVSFLTIVLFLVLASDFLKLTPKAIDYIKTVFAFVGYTSSDIASRFFSAINTRLTKIIDEKTHIADRSVNTEKKGGGGETDNIGME